MLFPVYLRAPDFWKFPSCTTADYEQLLCLKVLIRSYRGPTKRVSVVRAFVEREMHGHTHRQSKGLTPTKAKSYNLATRTATLDLAPGLPISS